MPRGEEQCFTYYTSSFHHPSVADLAYYALFSQSNIDKENHTTQERMPLPYQLLSKLDPHVDDLFLNRFAERTELLYRKSCLLSLLVSSSNSTGMIYGKSLWIKFWLISNQGPDLELTPLHFAVLQRSMDSAVQHMKKYRPRDETQQSEAAFSIVECAVGWQSGLILLSEAGYQLDDALRLAIFRGDLESLQTLLASRSYLTNSSLGFTLCLDCYDRSGRCTNRHDLFISAQHDSGLKQETMKLVVKEIKCRREQLLSFALRQLPKTAIQSLDLNSSQLPDTDAPAIADMLRKNQIELPACLEPGKTPAFHSFRMNCTQGGTQLADMLYDTGFTEIDAPDSEGMTPLQILVGAASYNWQLGADYSAIQWLVRHGADVNKSFGRDKVPLIFHLASKYDWHKVEDGDQGFLRLSFNKWNWESDSSLRQYLPQDYIGSENYCPSHKDWTRFIDSIISSVDGFGSEETEKSKLSGSDYEFDVSNDSSTSDDNTFKESNSREEANPRKYGDVLGTVAKHSKIFNDNCDCHCSGNGCLPTHKIPVLRRGSVKTWGEFQDDLFSWIEDCYSSESQAKLYVEAACRKELFERLGMAHTCCGRTSLCGSCGSCGFRKMSQKIRKELQAEDVTSKEQLDFMMNAFKCAIKLRAAWPLWEFWKWWWKVIDVILPPLLPWERGLQYCCPIFPVPRPLISHLMNVSAYRTRRLLKMAGYNDMDFLKIIQKHLAEFLNDDQQEMMHIRLPESLSHSHGWRMTDINPTNVESARRRKSKTRRTGVAHEEIFMICCCFKGRLCK